MCTYFQFQDSNVQTYIMEFGISCDVNHFSTIVCFSSYFFANLVILLHLHVLNSIKWQDGCK